MRIQYSNVCEYACMYKCIGIPLATICFSSSSYTNTSNKGLSQNNCMFMCEYNNTESIYSVHMATVSQYTHTLDYCNHTHVYIIYIYRKYYSTTVRSLHSTNSTTVIQPTNRVVTPLRPRADLLTADEDIVAVGIPGISRVQHSVEGPVYRVYSIVYVRVRSVRV